MKPKTAIQKGKDFEIHIAKELGLNGFSESRRESGSGSGLKKGDVFCPDFPFLIEAKNQKVVKINEWVDQSKRQAEIGFHDREKWVLMFKDTRTPNKNPTIYAVCDFYAFLDLAKRFNEPRIKEPDYNLKREVEALKYRSQGLIRKLNKLEPKDQRLIWEIEDFKKVCKNIEKLLS